MKQASVAPRLFGTNGVRGIVNKDLTPDLVLELALAIGTFFNGGEVVTGCDGRTSSPALLNLVIAGLNATGCNVRNIGYVPTPALQFLAKTWKKSGAVMVTASHNPPEYNGVKVIDRDGIEIVREDEAMIERIVYEKSWRRTDWRDIGFALEIRDAIRDYLDAIKLHVDSEAISEVKPKVVIDPANGVGGLATPILLREIGCRVITINSDLNGTFPGRPPEPTPENLQYLCETVKVSGADFGVAHDGDADRAIFVDETGAVQWGDRTFALIAKDFLAKNPGETIVTPVSSSRVIADIAESFGSRVEWTMIGSTTVSRVMQRIGAQIGGEENGGVFYGPHQPVRDGPMTAALIADILARSRKKLSALLTELPSYFILKDKVDCPEELKASTLHRIVELASAKRIETIDGVKIWLNEKSWVLLRPSGTEPIFRIIVESDRESEARRLLDRYKALVLEVVKSQS
jgi:phosphomannomutase/phosphoglucomutase